MTHPITDRVYGCLIGGAIGDVLGASVENWSYYRVQEEYGSVDTFESPSSRQMAGAVTGDTVMRQYLCLSIVDHGGRITPDEFAATLLDHLDPQRVWITEEIAVQKLAAGVNPWESGRGAIPAGTATMAIAPIGIINAANPRQAYQDGFNIASVNQDGAERDAAATVAAGIAEALAPDATPERVVETMLTHASESVYRAIDRSLALAEASDTVDDFFERFYQECLDWRWPAVEWDREKYFDGELFSASSLETVPAAVGILTLCDDPDQAIIHAADFGRNADTVGSIVGNTVGALEGASSINESWISQCEDANREFFEELHGDPTFNFETMAHRLVAALENEHQRTVERDQTLSSLL